MLNRSRLRFLMLAPAAMLTLLAGGAGHAARSSHFEMTSDGRLVDVQVLVGNQATPLYIAPGRWDRRYFQALRGRNYALAVTNNTGRRIGVLIAVDGLQRRQRPALGPRPGRGHVRAGPVGAHRDPRLALLARRRAQVRVRGRGAFVRRAHRRAPTATWAGSACWPTTRPGGRGTSLPNRINGPRAGRCAGVLTRARGFRRRAAGGGSRSGQFPEARATGGRGRSPRCAARRTAPTRRSAARSPRLAPSSPGPAGATSSHDPVRRVWFVPAPVRDRPAGVALRVRLGPPGARHRAARLARPLGARARQARSSPSRPAGNSPARTVRARANDGPSPR